jgi:hypothetical protein
LSGLVASGSTRESRPWDSYFSLFMMPAIQWTLGKGQRDQQCQLTHGVVLVKGDTGPGAWTRGRLLGIGQCSVE